MSYRRVSDYDESAAIERYTRDIDDSEAIYRRKRKHPNASLTYRERLFAIAYLETGGDLAASLRAAGSKCRPSGVASMAAWYLKQTAVQRYIRDEIKKLEEKAKISFEKNALRLDQCADRCGGEGDQFKPGFLIGAIAELNKMHGYYAPTKTVNANLGGGDSDDDLIRELVGKYRREY